jgi:hypothetical protein
LLFIEGVRMRPGENAGAELEKYAFGFRIHGELLHNAENKTAQSRFRYAVLPRL